MSCTEQGGPPPGNLEPEQKRYFRDLFREGRTAALKDAEGLRQILFALERLRNYLKPRSRGLFALRKPLRRLVRVTPLATEIPARYPGLHPPVDALFHQVRLARNDAAHEGAYARHLTQHAVELALIIEDALMHEMAQAQEFMVRDPVCAELWEPISFIRQKMLANSFSFLPVKDKNGQWKLVSDRALARFLREPSDKGIRAERLAMPLADALRDDPSLLEGTQCYEAEDAISEVAAKITDVPVLVVWNGQAIGIITAFDLL